MTGQPERQASADGPGNGSRAVSGLRTGVRALWLPISLLFYGFGLVLLNSGRVLTRISGWRFGRGE